MYNASVPISEDTIKKAKDAKVELWYQNIGMTRYNEGFLLWRTGAKGRRQFYANGTIADPTAHWPIGLLYFTKKDILISLSLERGREGGDDLKYVYTLESLIKEAKKDGQDTKESEKVLEDIYKELPVNIAEYSTGVYSDGSMHGFKMDFTKYDEYRRKIAEQIVKFSRLIKK